MYTLPPKPFNVGDKVECLHNYNKKIYAGGIYIVAKIEASGRKDCPWRWHIKDCGIYHRLDRWRLVNPFRRFILAIENDISI